jgi:multisubunit Na+/H+ antiporter MnhB subunit
MIQDLRENLKGTMAVVIGAVVLLAMVVTGQEVTKTSFTDTVASVNGHDTGKNSAKEPVWYA